MAEDMRRARGQLAALAEDHEEAHPAWAQAANDVAEAQDRPTARPRWVQQGRMELVRRMPLTVARCHQWFSLTLRAPPSDRGLDAQAFRASLGEAAVSYAMVQMESVPPSSP